MIKIPKIDIKPYLDIVLRRKWCIMVSFIAAIIAGSIYYIHSPKRYKASTLILVEPQKVSDSYVKSAVSGTIENRMRTITQQIYSRTNLESIVDRFDLVLNVEETQRGIIDRGKKFLNPDELSQNSKKTLKKLQLIENLRNNIKVNIQGRGREGNNAIEISINWHDPEIAAEVINFIADRFIEENLNVREELAMGTTDFLEREASRMRYELEAKEKELDDFKKRHMGMLPNQLKSNLNILNQLSVELNNLEKRLETEKQSALMLEAQMQQMKAYFQTDDTIIKEGINPHIEDLEAKLKALKLRYTDNYPGVIALKREIESARKEMADQKISEPGVLKASPVPPGETLGDYGTTISSQLDLAKNRIKSYENQIAEIRVQAEIYKERVEGTHQVELAMTKLLRDYETIKHRYDDLLSKSLGARMAEELERRQKGEQFRILDPAVVPVKPFSPDLKVIMFMTIIGGLALGCGLACLREIMDPCFYNPDEIESALNIKVMVSLPLLDFEKSGKTEKTNKLKSQATEG